MFADAGRTWGEAFAAGLEPDPDLKVSEWAAAHVVLPPEVTARPGPWDNALVPFGREIQDVLSPSHPAERVVLMKSAQVAGTAFATNWLMFVACAAAGPAMVVQPSIDLARAFSVEKLGPTIEATAIARKRVVEQKSRDGGSATRFKRFPGGFLVLTGANSAAGLRQRSIRYLLKDDLDGWPDEVDGEGDPSDLADKRCETFWNRKIFEVSTPTLKGFSKIEKAFEASDKRFYMVRCPHPQCGHEQRLVWERVQWTKGAPETAVYVCAGCGADIAHKHKPAMLAGGRWLATAPGPGKAVGFHISALYSPFVTWEQMARKHEAAEGDPKAEKVFTNTYLGETFEERGEAPPWEALAERARAADAYRRNTVPSAACFLTAGCDVQGDRLEVEVVGWAPGEVAYSIDYRVFYGNTADADDPCWRALAALYEETFFDSRGAALPIEVLAVDEGYRTQTVQTFVRGRMRAIAVKGVDGWKVPVLGRRAYVQFKENGRTIKRGHAYYPVGTWDAKREIYDRLGLAPGADGRSVPRGYCHFPADYPEDYFRGLTAETLISDESKGGYDRRRWKKTGRNEPLDCRVYAWAAACRAGMDKLSDAAWAALAAERAAAGPPAQGDLAVLWGGGPLAAVPARPAPAAGTAGDGEAAAGAIEDGEAEAVEIEDEPPAAPVRVAAPVAAAAVAGARRRGMRGRVAI
ncbi:phage terminase large subunit family protein [Brevundimonas sp.]|uniref:phage terminase large subunit family protein n=1 Tax=Brevundimonas sp. TaxID=1871086 RepID=UPI002D71F6B7|nr:terminase gpA endonuclease subunit [Brevundimonas sp.]HYD29203.1 terminase gpA endonuclease subunit [Brevundimonas sp.]